MPGPLTDLVEAYYRRQEWTMALPHLGLPGVQRHQFDNFEALPIEAVAEFNSRTKDPTILCVEYCGNGKPALKPVAAQVSGRGSALAGALVRLGVHPLDIVVATWRGRRGDFIFRSAVEHMFWTHEDQARLDREVASGAPLPG